MDHAEREPDAERPRTVPVLSNAMPIEPEGSEEREGPDDLVEECRMTLGDHIVELRARILICLAAFGVFFFAGIFAYTRLWQLVLLPLDRAADLMGLKPGEMDTFVMFMASGPAEGFVTVAKIAVDTALIGAMPVIGWQLWHFIAPGLTRRERRGANYILGAGSGLFFSGVATAFLYGVPLGLQFMLGFNRTLPRLENRWMLEKYLDFLSMACFGFGICFELPLVMMGLARVGIITPEGILRYWRHAVVVMVILGAIFTPPEPVTQLLLAGIMIALFFLGYGLACWVAPEDGVKGEGEEETFA